MTGVLIVGAGIGGLSAAIALGRAGQATSIIEQSTHLGELGAGVQLGPNVTRILRSWGVDKLLEPLAFEPNDLQVYEALSGEHLATLALGNSFQTRYGAPYLTLHRADLHSALYQCAVQGGYTNISLNSKLVHLQNDPNNKDVYSKVSKNWSPVAPQTTHDPSNLNAQSFVELNYKAVIGADGVWSRVRDIVYGSTSSVNFSGDLAYRSLVLQKMLPQHLRMQGIRVWLGPAMHLVQYPIRGGEWLNSVLILSTQNKSTTQASGFWGTRQVLDWTINMSPDERASNIQSIFSQSCSQIQDTLRAIDAWSVWPLMRAEPLSSAAQMTKDRVALLGDAAHPMLPYLAQGAGMAIEDAFVLGDEFARGAARSQPDLGIEAIFNRYSQRRWARNASVQSRALTNAKIFHADHLTAWARDHALKILGSKLLDMPWLYGYQA